MHDADILVIDADKQFIEYIHPAVARRLIKKKIVNVYSKNPFILQVDKIHTNKLRRGVTTLSKLAY